MAGIPSKQLSRDFLDFLSGGFRSRIQAGTNTADRTATLPDKTGTIALTSDIADHEAAANPHPGYLTPAEGDAAYQPLDGDLAAMADLTTTGLVERTGSGTAEIVQIGATGRASIGAATPEEGREAIEAASPLYVQSRGLNLITNGSGLLGNNYNFSPFTFDPAEKFSGGGSFAYQGGYSISYSDELIPVDLSRTWELSFYAKCGDEGGGNFDPANIQYAGIACRDIDALGIAPFHFMVFPGSALTTLAADLTPGDTTISLSDSSGWSNANVPHTRTIRWYGYTDSKGYTYPDYTYSRNVSSNYSSNNSLGTWNNGGISGNTITLRVPWAGPSVPSGTAVSNSQAGNGFKYLGVVGSAVPNSWAFYSGKMVGLDTARNNGLSFPPGTAFVQLVFLRNFPPTLATNKLRFSTIVLTDNIPENIVDGQLIQPSQIRINGGATLTAMLRATKTIAGTNPETITVPGAQVGDIVELSKPVNGEVTALNTITFDGTGLSGTLTAIVKRYT